MPSLKITAAMIFIGAIGCAAPKPQLSPAQKRQITTRVFEAEYETTYRATLTVLQDQGYIIKNTDMESGLINATVDRQVSTGSAVTQAIFLGYVADRGSEVDASFMLNKLNETKTEIRLNLQEAKYGQSNKWSSSGKQSVKQILDPGIFTQLFNEIQTEISRRQAIGR